MPERIQPRAHSRATLRKQLKAVMKGGQPDWARRLAAAAEIVRQLHQRMDAKKKAAGPGYPDQGLVEMTPVISGSCC
jgi:hypothetical protein